MPRQSVCDNPACNHKILKSHESYWQCFYPVEKTFCRKCWKLVPMLTRPEPVFACNPDESVGMAEQ